MRVPGLRARSFGSSIFMICGERYAVTTVASLEVGLEQIADDERDAMCDFRFVGGAPRQLDQLRIDLDADAARAVFLRRDDRDAAIARAEVVDDVAGADAGELQHRIGDVVARRSEMNVGRAGRLLNQRQQQHRDDGHSEA